MTPDQLVLDGGWSDLSRFREPPKIDIDRMRRWRAERLRGEMRAAGASALVLVNPVSMRYAVDFDSYMLFQSHTPTAYLFMAPEGPSVMHGACDPGPGADRVDPAHYISFFDAGDNLTENARKFAESLEAYLSETGAQNRCVALEYVNPSVTQACLQRGLEVIDGAAVSERARLIKSEDEIACIRWAVAVAEHGMAKMRGVLRSGVTETQLWGILNYANLANHGGWHDGRMLASGPRTNPWMQEASQRVIESGDLVAFDTDMIGPMGYFCDISRTFHCGPARPTRRQKQIYRMAHDELRHNTALLRPGVSFRGLQEKSWPIPDECRENAYPCIFHGVGMCDEYPRIDPAHRGPNPYDGVLAPGMVLSVESYMGPKGELNGVKLEEQVLITEDGYEMLSSFPMEDALLD